MRGSLAALLSSLCLCWSSGCYSTSLLQEPRMLPKNALRMHLGVGAHAPRKGAGGPNAEALVRFGVAEHCELQWKVSNIGSLGMASKIQLLERAPWRTQMLIGVQKAKVLQSDPSRSFPRTLGVLGFNMTPVVSHTLGDFVDLMVAPDVQIGTRGSKSRLPWFGLGGRAGVAVHSAERFTIVPECSVLWVAVGPNETDEPNLDSARHTVFTQGDVRGMCTLGVSFGDRYR